ncbi:MAG: endonuclease [Owenweeksia sp.]|nr:endonuclease [Owenweeksia sp.]MBG00180.1 endonuclease [Owenweeksia sp.]
MEFLWLTCKRVFTSSKLIPARKISWHALVSCKPVFTQKIYCMKFNKILGAALLCGAAVSCETDDVDDSLGGPEITLNSPVTAITEDNGSTDIAINLSASSEQEVTVNLSLSGNAEGNGVDYNISTTAVTFAAGEITKTVTITAVQDELEEGNETIQIGIESASGGRFDAGTSVSLFIEDDDVVQTPQLILNEILYDPSNSGLEGDANGNGSYAQNEDEFLEFVNLSTQPLDVSGWEVYDDENLATGTPNHKIPTGTIIPGGKALVIFGGGNPNGTFGGALVQTSTSGDLNLNNAGDIMTLKDANGNVILTFDIEPLSNNPNESYTRNPDLTGEFEQHGENTALLFSPGTRIDGSPF